VYGYAKLATTRYVVKDCFVHAAQSPRYPFNSIVMSL
jgi:hypothetical protein